MGKEKISKFTGAEGGPIDLHTAKKWTANYRRQKEKRKEKYIKANFFGCDIIRKILSEEGCKGIRIYYAVDDKGQQQLLLVGADAKMNSLVPSTIGKDGSSYTIADRSVPCPDECPDLFDPLGSG